MIKTFFLLLIFSCCVNAYSQKKILSNLEFAVSGGYNVHFYIHNYPGWYVKTALSKKIIKNANIGLRYYHTSYNSFPDRFQVFPFQPPQEQAIIDRWKGISEYEWIVEGKGFYTRLIGDIISLNGDYSFYIKKRFFIRPKIGISRIQSTYIDVGIFEASFVNNKLVDGTVGYDVRYSKLWAWNFGFDLGYKLNNNWKLFFEIEDNRDIDGDGWGYYESKQFGLGAAYSFNSVKK